MPSCSAVIKSVSCSSVKLKLLAQTKQKGHCHCLATCWSRKYIFSSLLLSSYSTLGEFASYSAAQIYSDISLVLKKISFYLFLWPIVHTVFYPAAPIKTVNTNTMQSGSVNGRQQACVSTLGQSVPSVLDAPSSKSKLWSVLCCQRN